MPTLTEKTALKYEFRSPKQIPEKEMELRKANLEKFAVPQPPLAVSAAPIVGTWVNCDHQTHSLVRVAIAPKGNEITVHAFGACTPPCDWGIVHAMVFADSVVSTPAVAFIAHYKFSFAETTIIGHLYMGLLYVETFDHFIDNSGRADDYSLDIMGK
jgi:hypothetical protein